MGDVPTWISRLATDPSVTPDALRLILFVSARGEGWHEIPADELRMALRCRGDRPLYEARKVAVRHGLEWKQGGRDHSNSYRYVGAHDDVKDTSAPTTTYPDTYVGSDAEVSGYVGAHDDVNNAPPPPPVTTPPPPPPNARAREFVEGRESMVGCRGAAIDYLAAGRIDGADRQLAWTHSVASMIEGGDEAVWMLDDGSHVPTEDRPAIVAAALNELRQTDEIGKHFRHPPGHIRNLRGKVRYAVRSLSGAKRDAQRRSTSQGTTGETRTAPADGADDGIPDVHLER